MLRYASLVVRRTWLLIGHADLLLGLVLAAVAVLDDRDVIKNSVANAIVVVGASALVAVTLATLVLVAPFLLWRDERRRVDTLTAAPDLSLTIVGPTPWREPAQLGGQAVDGWLIRVMVENCSVAGHHLHARVLEADGIPPGPEPPWWIPWRHGAGQDYLLLPGDREMLKIGWASDQTPDRHVNILEPTGEKSHHGRAPSGNFRLLIGIWDRDTTMSAGTYWLTVDNTGTAPVVALEQV